MAPGLARRLAADRSFERLYRCALVVLKNPLAQNVRGEHRPQRLTCDGAELTISRGLDGRLKRSEAAALRAHLRGCADCTRFAHSQHAQRAALRVLAAIPLPVSLHGFGGALTATTPPVSIVNRRNAVLGWGVWSIGKRVAKRKAKSAPPSKTLWAAAIAGAVGALAFWRRHRDDDS